MKITLICVGKTDERYLHEGVEKYRKRLVHYAKFQEIIIPDVKNRKNLSEAQQKEKEGQFILKYIGSADTLILLDERGKNFDSIGFSEYIDQYTLRNIQHLVFVIGGPYGFSPDVYARANTLVSLSKMTFSHQMIRLFFMEQLYRCFTIIKGEPYHHV